MGRSLLSVLAGTVTMILCTLIAGLVLLPLFIRMWLIPLGFFLACLIIGVVGRLRVLHLLLISFMFYIGLMVFFAVNVTFLTGIQFPPLYLNEISSAWNGFQFLVNSFVPFLTILSDVAATVRAITGGISLMAIFLEFFVASLFIGVIGLLLTAISGYLTREPALHVVTAPEPSVEIPEFDEPTTQSSFELDTAQVPAQSAHMSPQSSSFMEAPPPMSVPRSVEEVSPPLPSKDGSPSAQAIASLKGKVTKHLKGTGQKVPAGQSRCPHCNATIIHGSQFCNACGKSF